MQRVGVLTCLPAVLRDLGADRDAVLRDAGLSPGALDRPDLWVPVSAVPAVLMSAAKRARCDHIGLLVGRGFRFEHLGLLGELITNSPTVGDAMASYAVHQRLYSQSFTPYLHKFSQTAEYGFAIYQSTPFSLVILYDLLLTAAVTALRLLCGESWCPKEVCFPRFAPPEPTPYRANFRCKLVFESDRASVVFPHAVLDLPIAVADPLRFRALEKEVSEKFDGNLLPLVFRSIRASMVSGEPKVARLAQDLGMHERTLGRRLRAQGSSFRLVLDQVRYDAACGLLSDTNLTLSSVAFSLGYSELTAFSRAFRRWAGVSPGAWRAKRRKQQIRLSRAIGA